MKRLILQIIIGILGLGLAIRFVPDVEFDDLWPTLIWAGIFLGLINFFIKPIVKIISLPIRILTFGLFGLIINMAMIWFVDIFFGEIIDFVGISPLFWTSVIIWGLNLIFSPFVRRQKRREI